VRIVAISDIHGYLPPIPACDLLLVVGDVCPDHYDGPEHAREHPELQRRWLHGPFKEWIGAIPLPPSHKVFTWGNHDFVGEHADGPALASALGITLAVDEVVAPGGLRIWLSPWCNPLPGDWAFVRPLDWLRTLYASIPDDVDVIATHQPPFGYGDLEVTAPDRLEHVGSVDLVTAIDRVQPQIVLCGHIQRAAGAYTHGAVPILNISVLDGAYQPTNAVTVLELGPRPRPLPSGDRQP
jgi:hypothetical protein